MQIRFPSIISALAILFLISGCQRNDRDQVKIIETDRIPASQEQVDSAAGPASSDFDPASPVGNPEAGELPQRQLGEFMTVIPEDATAWPNGEPFPPEFLEIIRKLESGEPLTEDDRITFRAFDSKWRVWDEIEAIGNSQADS